MDRLPILIFYSHTLHFPSYPCEMDFRNNIQVLVK